MGLDSFFLQQDLFAKLGVTSLTILPCDERMDVSGNPLFDIMKIIGGDWFVTVDAHGGELRMPSYQACFK
jgi:hypothetical protein